MTDSPGATRAVAVGRALLAVDRAARLAAPAERGLRGLAAAPDAVDPGLAPAVAVVGGQCAAALAAGALLHADVVVAGSVREAGHEVRIIEGESDLGTQRTRNPPFYCVAASAFSDRLRVVAGGTFRYRAYDHAVHVSSKYLTAFTDLRLDAEEQDHLPITRYLEYLDECLL